MRVAPAYMNVSAWLLRAALVLTLALVLFSPAAQAGALALPYSSSMLRQMGYVFAFLLTVAAVPALGASRAIKSVPGALVASLMWFSATVFWSNEPSTSVLRLGLLFILVWNILITIRGLGFDRSVRTIALLLYIVLAINIVTVIIAPDIGTNYHPHPLLDHQWRGLMGDKNAAGAVCALTIVLVLYPPLLRNPQLRWAAALPPAVFLLFSLSRTAMIALVVTLTITGALKTRLAATGFKPTNRISSAEVAAVWMPYGAVLLLAALASTLPDMIAPLLSDRSAMSNRAAIWWPLLQEANAHPLQGLGYGAFWNSSEDPLRPDQAPWLAAVAQAHNGYLDLLLQAGLVGLALGMLAVYVYPVRRLFRLAHIQPDKAALAVGTLVFCLVSNATESGLLTSDSVWTTFLLVGVALTETLTTRSGNRGRRRGAHNKPSGELEHSKRTVIERTRIQ